MFQRNINNVIYLFITTVLLYATALHIPDDQRILDDDQLNYISDVVCGDLQDYINTTSNECVTKFWSPTVSSETLPSTIVIKCRSATSIRFQIPPSKHWQLVMLVPEPSDRNVYFYDIEYVLIEPMIEHEKLLTMSKNYTIWNTDLLDGVPLLWRGGDKLPQFNESARPEHINYNITVDFSTTFRNENLQLNGFFQWNTSDVDDVCFDVVDSCTKSDTAVFVQKPEVLLKGLNMNATCHFKLSGLYGTTDFEYSTPPCDDPILCMSVTMTVEELLKFRNPPRIDVLASAESDNTWTVLVNWTRPVVLPDQYNVTLRAKYETSLVVPGTATNATFGGVAGQDFYNVSIYSVLGNATHTSKRGHFPPRREASDSRWTGLVAAASVCAALAACAALLGALCRRGRDNPPAPFDFSPEEKLPKEVVKQTQGPESENVADEWEVQPDNLLLLEVIGEGAFGVVRRGTLSTECKDVAVKMLKEYPSIEEVRAFRSEMELMKSVGIHPHIVSLVGCCSGKRPLIVAEYCSRGDLLSYLRCCWDVFISKRKNKNDTNNCTYTADHSNHSFKNCKTENEHSKLVNNKLYDYHEAYDEELTPVDLLSFCRQIVKGMEYLASNRVVHRDLAARNILVTNDKTLKIADFGLSRDIYEENQYKQKRNGKMPIKWMAPESLMRMVFTTHSDVWSFGVVMWEVTTVGATPYPDIPTERLLRMLRSGYRMPRPSNASENVYELMLSCWRANPRERPTFAELHAQLDALLHAACADQYLALELGANAPPTPPPRRYFNTLISSGKLTWFRRESYERPLEVTSDTPYRDNRYISPPSALSRQPA